MKSTKLKKALGMLYVIMTGIFICALYAVYVPLAIIRVLVDKKGFGEFIDCVGDCVKNMTGWFRKGAE